MVNSNTSYIDGVNADLPIYYFLNRAADICVNINLFSTLGRDEDI